MIDPNLRTLDFTEKCQSAAKREQMGLIKTVDLFKVCRTISENENMQDYAKSCRDAIKSCLGGIIVFPRGRNLNSVPNNYLCIMDRNSEEYQQMRDKALSQLRSGESLTGKDGAFGPLLKEFLEAALDGEMSSHLDDSERLKGNKRNGRGSKRVKTMAGEIDIVTPQDRHSSFSPEILKKRETILADNMSSKIISLYGMGLSLRDISSHIEEMYDVEISHNTLSEIIERIVPKVKEWQSRPLESMYTIVWLDAMHYKVKDGGRTESRAVYNVLAVNKDGHKELIGMYVSESEGANFWLSVLTDLKARGMKDVLIACIDNLTGFAEAISTIFPEVIIQNCVIHQIRNSLKYIASKDQKSLWQI